MDQLKENINSVDIQLSKEIIGSKKPMIIFGESFFKDIVTIDGLTTLNGITTVTAPTLFAKQLNIAGVSSFIGITTFGSDLFVGGDLYVGDDTEWKMICRKHLFVLMPEMEILLVF